MKMYADLTVEGTPEECAAFKHIDAALTTRNKRPTLAIEGPSPKKATRAPRMRSQEVETVIQMAANNGGITARQMADHFQIHPKTARNRLNRLHDQGRLWLTAKGVFKATKEAM